MRYSTKEGRGEQIFYKQKEQRKPTTAHPHDKRDPLCLWHLLFLYDHKKGFGI
jgi:hypothetical protein